jgi:methylated-DNA-protein-cysteine methyltransferase-like protein
VINLSAAQRDEYFSRVWALVREVPPGMVVSYGQLAERLDPPLDIPMETYRTFGSRLVGQAMRGCPADVPWQRVINAQGRISLPGEGGRRQRELLEDEGVVFDERERVSFKIFGWVNAESSQSGKAQPGLPGMK